MVNRPPRRQEHPYYMHDCIRDQPEAIARILETQGSAAGEIAALASRAKRIHVCGIGTSWHAALVGEHLFRSVGVPETRAWHSFEFVSYPPPLTGEDLVIVMAHSGTKHYSTEALELAREAGAMTAIVTSLTSEARLEQADVVVRTTYRDRSSAFTVSHTGAMSALALAASRTPGGERIGRGLGCAARCGGQGVGARARGEGVGGEDWGVWLVLFRGVGAERIYGLRGGAEDQRGGL